MLLLVSSIAAVIKKTNVDKAGRETVLQKSMRKTFELLRLLWTKCGTGIGKNP